MERTAGRFSPNHIYLVMKGVTWFCFTTAFTLSALYRIQVVGLDPLQLVLVGTVLEGAIFLCEIPTGVVADTRGRRISIISGLAIVGLGFLIEGLSPHFLTILCAQVVWGFGYTLVSGAEDAWLADEIGEDNLPQVYLRGTQVQQVASFLGIFASVLIARGGLHQPFLVAGGGLLALALGLTLTMPEHGFTPAPKTSSSSWQDLRHTLGEGLRFTRRRPLLQVMMGISLCYGLSSEGLDRLWEKHLLESVTFPSLGSLTQDLTTFAWFGAINAAAMICTLLATEGLRRRASNLGPRRIASLLLVLDALRLLALISFALAGEFVLAVVTYSVGYVLRHSAHPLFMAWVNRGIESRVRATVLSTVNQMDAFGQVAGGPLVGLVGQRLGLRIALGSLAVLLFPVLPLFRKSRQMLNFKK